MNSIVFKLGLSIISLIIIVIFPVGYVVDKVFSNFYYQKAAENLSMHCNEIIEIIASKNSKEVEPSILVASHMTKSDVILLDSSRKVALNSGTNVSLNEVLSSDEWEHLKAGTPIESHLNAPDSILIGKPVMSNGHFNGAVLMLSSTKDIQSSISQIRNLLIFTGFGAILLALGFTFILVRKLSVPMLNMEKVAREMAGGNLNVRVEHSSNDEIGSLATAINELAASLKRYEDTRKEFFVTISHELRTPLTYVEGYVGLLNENQIPMEERSQVIQTIIGETKRLKGLVDDLFDLSKLEEGKIALTLEWIDLTEVIENSFDNVRIRAERKNIQLFFNEEDIPLMYLDGHRMQQIFINLLDNAIRYTENGKVIISIRNDNDYVGISVEDTGIGIPKEELPFIFERFHRVEKSRSREYGGSGLGLAIVKRLVEIQGGSIQVESNIGVGTKFTLTFPIPQEDNIR